MSYTFYDNENEGFISFESKEVMIKWVNEKLKGLKNNPNDSVLTVDNEEDAIKVLNLLNIERFDFNEE